MISATGDGESSSSSSTSHPCRIFSFAEIQSFSRDFDDDLVIGEGGFGKVYKGQISTQQATQFVAIKRLDSMSSQGEAEFRAEIDMLTKLRHSNLVSLIGYCNDNGEMILVYDYLPNGTLHHHLHKGNIVLSWVKRIKIAIGAARGLDYLHNCVGIHRDVKTSNILLDKNWDAMISDFGLSKIGPTNQLVSYVDASVKGTFGYLDPVYFYTKKLTRKTDVYAFGVVLFELLSGRLPVDERYEKDEQCSLVLWAEKCVKERKVNQMVDPNIEGTIYSKCLKQFALIAYRCVHSVPKERPTMTELVASLQALLKLQEKSDHFSGTSAGTVGFNRKIRRYFTLATKPNSAEEDPEAHLEQFDYEHIHLGKLKRFSLRELQVATNNFSNRQIVGRGGFGKVYKGRLADGTLVAVKRLGEGRTEIRQLQFEAEVGMIYMDVHRNVLRLKGFCMTPTERLLVYPFMANGSVASCLRDISENQEPLNWPIRKQIALGSARGLAQLHDRHLKIIHRDVKAANILLDEEFEAVVGDFTLAKCIDYNYTHVTTAVRGTIGHIAPEYLSTGKCSAKTDVFGYGVMLLELITGQRAFDLARLANDEDVMMLDWVKGLTRVNKLETLIDADLKGNYIDDEVEQLIQVALLCTQGTPSARPTMSEVVRMLEGDRLAERWEKWNKDEMFGHEFNSSHTMFANWTNGDSTNNLRAAELSGPR